MTTVIDFHDRHLRLDTAAEVRVLFRDVDLSQVEDLRMSGTSISGAAGKELGVLFKQMSSLQVAHFADIFVSRSIDEVPIAISAICDALIECHELVELDLSNNAFGSRVAPLLVPLLENAMALQVLKINNCGLGPEGGNAVAGALVKAAERRGDGKRRGLKVLICGRNRLEDGSAATWGRVFERNTTLQKVKMVNNGFSEPGVIALAKGLQKCIDLRHLNLRDCTAHNVDLLESVHQGRRGWHELADAIRSSPSLEFLDLSDAYLTSDGSLEILKALSDVWHPRLETILLENDDLDSRHYELFKELLKPGGYLSGLKILDVALNEDLEDNTVLEDIQATFKARGGKLLIDDEECDALDLQKNALDLLKESRFIRSSPVAQPMDEEGQEDIDELLKRMSIVLEM